MQHQMDINEVLPRNIQSYQVLVQRLKESLVLIKPQKGNFLFRDIVGRVTWSSCTTAKSIEVLAIARDSYGIKSIVRKLWEAYLTLEHLFNAPSKDEEIARIMAYEYFDKNHPDNTLEKVFEQVEEIIIKAEESLKILDYFRKFLNSKRKHWHWSEKSFDRLIQSINKTGNSSVDHLIHTTHRSFLKAFHKGMHIDLNLQEDLLTRNDMDELEYMNPFTSSKEDLFAYLGLSRMIIKNIIWLIEEKKHLLA